MNMSEVEGDKEPGKEGASPNISASSRLEMVTQPSSSPPESSSPGSEMTVTQPSSSLPGSSSPGLEMTVTQPSSSLPWSSSTGSEMTVTRPSSSSLPGSSSQGSEMMVTQPSSSLPGSSSQGSEMMVTQPSSSLPGSSSPGSEMTMTQPSSSQPGSSSPGSEMTMTQPSSSQPGSSSPGTEMTMTQPSSSQPGSTSSESNQHNIDSGWAWMVLVACCLNHMLCDGVISSFGVFIVAWQQQFPGSLTRLSWISSLAVGVTHIAGPLGSILGEKFSIRQVVMTGTILASISLAAASQATSLWHLYVTFASAGLGFGLVLQPSYIILTYYFDKLLARANGIAFAGVSMGIFALPPLFQVLIDFYGWQGALIVLAAIVANLGICAAIYRPNQEVENRTSKQNGTTTHNIELNDIDSSGERALEKDQATSDTGHQSVTILELDEDNINTTSLGFEQETSNANYTDRNEDGTSATQHSSSQVVLYQKDTSTDPNSLNSCKSCHNWGPFELFTNIYFLLLLSAYFFHGLAYIIVVHYLSIRAVGAGISELNAAYLISTIGISSLVSRLTHGYIIDYQIMSATVLTAISYAVCGIGVILNPVSDSYQVLTCLSIVFGLTSGICNSTVPITTKEYVGANKVSSGIGWILLVIGVASILGAYLTGVLADTTGSYDIPFFLAGACFLLCSLLIFAFPGIKFFTQLHEKHNI